ncbi:hypothetical protein C444_07960 [Haloarcula japonica DSM 6131]|uniref:Uncharacterized protein n=2 Tax=Haloarcula TaxID=2237 RepID=A0A830EP75_9EURY|nr:hypothetical protein C444_07960 [Haloarcula japonica DSM 6131]GGK79920.1 hypothetical protein GCM10009067_35300 [Haloarcula sebkhae]
MLTSERFEVKDREQAKSVLSKVNTENALKFLSEPTNQRSDQQEQIFVACSIPNTELEYRTREGGQIRYCVPEELLGLLLSDQGMVEFAPADQFSITTTN